MKLPRKLRFLRLRAAAPLAAPLLAAVLLACRLTAGPPPKPSPAPLPSNPSALAGGSGAPATQASLPRLAPTGPTQTPVLPPSPSPSPTFLARLPVELPRIRSQNLANFRPLARLGTGHALPFTGIGISQDGQFLAAVDCSQGLQLWEVASGESLQVQAAEDQTACQGSWPVIFSPAGRVLVTALTQAGRAERAAGLQVWTLSPYFGARPAQTLSATRKTVSSLAFSPDGRLLVAGTTENQAIFWFFTDPIDPAAGLTELGVLPHGDWVTSVAISPDGRLLATASAEQTGGAEPSGSGFTPLIQLWKVSSLLLGKLEEVRPTAVLSTLAGPIRQLAFSPDSRLLAAAGEVVTIWETAGGEQAANLEGTADSLAFSPDGALLASGGQAGLSLWDLQAALKGDPQSQSTFLSPGGEIEQLAFVPDGRSLAVLSADGSLWLWGVAP
ncbi:MAG TPA: hypothetical protein VJ436_13060 [Anaerolineales bacterium]|nr:hypothetical protein [Anaerolineales bacterium]